MTTLADPLNLNNQRRRRWTEVAEQMADKMVPPVVMFGGTLLQFTTSTAIRTLLLLLAVVWLFKESRKTTKNNVDEEISSKTGNSEAPEPKEEDDKSKEVKSTASAEKSKAIPDLFPSITDVIMQTEGATAKSCSTGLTTRLLPFKNKNGEIEWAFTDDLSLPGSELDVFKIKSDNQLDKEGKIERDALTPTTSNSSNSDSIIENGQYRNIQKLDDTPLTNNSSFSEGEEDDKGKTSSGGEQDGTVHQCPHCDVSFKIRGYLTRHLKKHAVKKAYLCPFYNYSIYVDENNLTHKCHPNGGFSRRDTYKTHLKSRHFKYPKGVKTKERTNSPGYCGMCNEYFPNSEIWCEIHIEGGECRHLPTGFKGKSRIKNKLRKEQRQRMKENGKQQLAEGNMSTALLTSPSKTPSNYDTPQSYAYYPQVNSGLVPNNNTNSPALSSNSDMAFNYVNTPNSLPSTTYPIPSPPNKAQVEINYGQMNIQQHQYANQLQHQQMNIQQQQGQQQEQPFLQFDQFQHGLVVHNSLAEDYDDEYCLDVDQLIVSNSNLNQVNTVIGGETYF